MNRFRADVATVGMQSRAARNGSGGDMAAARDGGKVAGHVLHRQVASGGFQMRGTADVPGHDRAAGGNQGGAPADIPDFDISAAGDYIYVVVLGNVQLD